MSPFLSRTCVSEHKFPGLVLVSSWTGGGVVERGWLGAYIGRPGSYADLNEGWFRVTEHQDQLIQAIAKNDAFRVQALIHEDPAVLKSRDREGRTPLMLCLYFGHEDLAHLVRERHPDPDFFELVALGDTEAVREVLARAPKEANAVAPDGFSVLGLAAFFGRTQTAEALLDAGADPDTPAANSFHVRPIHSAAANRKGEESYALCKLLLEKGANPNVRQAGGWTPLHQAAAHGRKAGVELLLAHGAEASAKSADDRTPAQMAEAKGHDEIRALLLDRET